MDEEELQNHRLTLRLIEKDLNFTEANEDEALDEDDNEYNLFICVVILFIMCCISISMCCNFNYYLL
jgi:hypothetical protein